MSLSKGEGGDMYGAASEPSQSSLCWGPNFGEATRIDKSLLRVARNVINTVPLPNSTASRTIEDTSCNMDVG
jgi:hypothetical protein